MPLEVEELLPHGKQKEIEVAKEKGWRLSRFSLAGNGLTVFLRRLMRDYFIRRFLLIPPTLLGISMVVFAITRLAPGGPVEEALMQMRRMSEEGESRSAETSQAVSEEQRKQLERYYGYDKPAWEAYLVWLGVLPGETGHIAATFEPGEDVAWVRVRSSDEEEKKRLKLVREGQGARMETEDGNWELRTLDTPKGSKPGTLKVEIFEKSFSGVLQGNLGRSFRYGKAVEEVLSERLPVSTYFGIMTLLLTYSVCIPLGIIKAMKHNTWIDNSTSVLIFMGYAIPGYVLGFLLILFCSVQWEWFPDSGFTGSDFEELGLMGKALDVLHHSVLPLCAYLVGSFAFVTMLMKNHLMDNLAADYVRTALAKGVKYRDAVRKHALRNSMIPIATNLGHQVTLFVTGSFLIEKIFDINGFGLLGFNSIIDRDYPVVMGILILSAFLMLLGNVISDALVALADPRVRFE